MHTASHSYADQGELNEQQFVEFLFNSEKDPDNNEVALKYTHQQYHLMRCITPYHFVFRVREIRRRR